MGGGVWEGGYGSGVWEGWVWEGGMGGGYGREGVWEGWVWEGWMGAVSHLFQVQLMSVLGCTKELCYCPPQDAFPRVMQTSADMRMRAL